MSTVQWIASGEYSDILYHKAEGIAKITINRPEVRNAFRPQTVEQMISALSDARNDETVGVVILTGAGDMAFCSGGDQKIRGYAGYADGKGVNRLNVLDFQRDIRTCPKPVIAMVAGYAIGGGHVLHMLCDLTIAAETLFSARQAPRSAHSTAAGGQATWPALSARKRPGKYGISAASTTQRKPLTWGLGQYRRTA